MKKNYVNEDKKFLIRAIITLIAMASILTYMIANNTYSIR